MTPAVTLSLYISRLFAAAVTVMLLALTGLVSLFDFIELLRRSASRPDATFGLVSQIVALRLPYIAMQILPFAVLLGGILCFWRLTRSSELIVAREKRLASDSCASLSKSSSPRSRRSCLGGRSRSAAHNSGNPAPVLELTRSTGAAVVLLDRARLAATWASTSSAPGMSAL